MHIRKMNFSSSIIWMKYGVMCVSFENKFSLSAWLILHSMRNVSNLRGYDKKNSCGLYHKADLYVQITKLSQHKCAHSWDVLFPAPTFGQGLESYSSCCITAGIWASPICAVHPDSRIQIGSFRAHWSYCINHAIVHRLWTIKRAE